MFDSTSRYFPLETATLERRNEDGSVTQTRYVKRRLLDKVDNRFTWVGTHKVQSGERLDNIAARYFGDPTLFWRICDTQLEPDPFALLDIAISTGQLLRIGYRLPSA